MFGSEGFAKQWTRICLALGFVFLRDASTPAPDIIAYADALQVAHIGNGEYVGKD